MNKFLERLNAGEIMVADGATGTNLIEDGWTAERDTLGNLIVTRTQERKTELALGTTVEKTNSAWKYGYLVWIGVRPGLQKKGVGDGLFNEIKKRMMEQGVRMVIIDTDADNEAGIRFFKKHGFGNIQKHVYMTLNLAKKTRRRTPRKS